MRDLFLQIRFGRRLADSLCSAGKRMLILLAIVVAATGCDRPRVEVLSPQRKTIQETFTEPARTRLRHTYPITMPVNGRIARVTLEPGDKVQAGQELIAIDRVPFEQAVAEAEAQVKALQAQLKVQEYNRMEELARTEADTLIRAGHETLKASAAQVEAAQARADRTTKERKRMEALAAKQTVSPSALEDAVLAAETALADLRREQFVHAALKFLVTAIELGPDYVDRWLERKTLQREVVQHQLEAARAQLARARHQLDLARVIAPVNGTVLRRYHRGDGVVAAGTPLLDIGTRADLEVLAEVLTEDAVRLRVGSRVLLHTAAQAEPLLGEVDRIEPAGFTKLSSLGVEQQRVNVLVRLPDPPAYLGVGYRLQAEFILGTRTNALVLPRYSVSQADDGSYYVWRVSQGRLRRSPIQVGLSNDLEIEVTQGLSPEDLVVAHPDTTLREGERVHIERRVAPDAD